MFSDVLRPIRELVQPTEGLPELLLAEKLAPMAEQMTLLLLDLQFKAVQTLIAQHKGE